MKKKIINGLLFAVALVAATSSFVSCKDYEGDNYAELQEKYATLQDAFNAQVQAMQDYVLTSRYNAETGYSPELLVAKGTIAKRLSDLEQDSAYQAAQIAALQKDSIQKYVGIFTEAINENNKAIKKAQALAEKDSTLLHKLVALWGDDLDAAVGKAAEVLKTVAQDSAKWNEAYDSIAKNAKSWNDARDSLLKHQDEWNEAYDSIAKRSKEWNRAVETADKAYDFVKGSKYDNIQDLEKAFEDADKALADDIAALNEDLDKVLEALQAEITGITIQATSNPIFGSFAYPIDVQSNILATYFGEVTNGDFDFPVGDQYPDLWVGGAAAVLKSELDEIGAPAYHVPEVGILMNEGAGNAGKLYVTVNPSNVNFEGKYFTLRTSDNQVSKVTLSSLEPCTEQLKWGYQRANSANGFYVANAEIAKDDVKSVALNFNMKNIASEVEGIMQDWSKTSAADVAKLGLDIVENLKVDAPRLGVQAQWNDPVSGWKNYVSKYDLAAVSVRPLGFHEFYDADYSPAIVKLHNQLVAKEKAISMELINEIKGLINVNIGLPASAGNIRTTADGKVFIDINENVPIPSVGFTATTEAKTTTITITAGQFGTIEGAGPGGTDLQIPDAPKTITVNIPAVTANGTSAASSTAVNASIEITSLFNAIKNGIQNSLSGINKITGKVESAVNKLINFENKVFGKIESVLKNPNRFLQPALIAYSNDLKFFYPSRIYFAPTQVKKGTKVMFYPTSLNGEVVAPAFKKYVAVCGAWDVDNINNTKDVKKYNTGALNTVFDGTTYNLQKPFEYTVDAPAGTVIEIIYECLGYDGKVAGKKYYIEVYE